MSRREEYEKRAEELLAPIVELNGFELVDVEYVKEAGNWYLRGYIDKPGGITVNDCETVSRAFSDKLDENDFIEDSYIMEISSPGLDRPLKKDKDFERNMGKLVEIRTYRPIEKQKEFCGILTAYDSNSVTIDEDGTIIIRPVFGSFSLFNFVSFAWQTFPFLSLINSVTVVWYTRGSCPNTAIASSWP